MPRTNSNPDPAKTKTDSKQQPDVPETQDTPDSPSAPEPQAVRNQQPQTATLEIPLLHLTEKQIQAAKLWHEGKDRDEIATTLDISPAILTAWTNQKRFIVEIAIQRQTEYKATTEEIQAVALILDNVSYIQAEHIIGLEEGTITQWEEKHEQTAFYWILDDAISQHRQIMNQNADSDEDVDSDEAQASSSKLLSEDQLKAIPLMVQGKTDTEVAEAIGKRRETINRWRNRNRNFSNELKAARKRAHDAQTMALAATEGKAITVLNGLLESDDEKIKLQAATLLINGKSASSTQKKKEVKTPKS